MKKSRFLISKMKPFPFCNWAKVRCSMMMLNFLESLEGREFTTLVLVHCSKLIPSEQFDKIDGIVRRLRKLQRINKYISISGNGFATCKYSSIPVKCVADAVLQEAFTRNTTNLLLNNSGSVSVDIVSPRGGILEWGTVLSESCFAIRRTTVCLDN